MKSFLKWAGGKSKILNILYPLFPNHRRFIEPFCGSGVVSINNNCDNCFLFDLNYDLINTFNILKNYKQDFIDDCKNIFQYNKEEEYYQLRETFNTTQDLFEKAKLFVYLNRYGYNGLCRYNKKGLFNVPFGKYKTIYFPEEEMQYIANKETLHFFHNDYKEAFSIAEPNDLIYCDPPYSPLEQKTNFSSYTRFDFSENQHIELKNKIEEAKNKGVKIIISNHDTEFTRELYKGADNIISLEVQRSISSTERKKIKELIAIYGIKND